MSELPESLSETASVGRHRLLSVLARRYAAGSRPQARDDSCRVALAIEGGGMRGTVSAGMALAVHELGLLPLFDAVYGASAGAISAAWLLSSRPEGLRGWTDPIFARTLIRRRNLLRSRPVVDVETLIETVYTREFPLDYASVLAGRVEFHPLATDVATGAPADLHAHLTDEAHLRLALRASACLPLLAGPPVALGGGRYYDAGLAESIPFPQALKDGATHVLVLRSRRPQDRARDRATPTIGSRLVAHVGLRRHPMALRTAYLTRNAELAAADILLDQHTTDEDQTRPALYSVRPHPDSPYIGRLGSNGRLLQAGFEAGHTALTAALTPVTGAA